LFVPRELNAVVPALDDLRTLPRLTFAIPTCHLNEGCWPIEGWGSCGLAGRTPLWPITGAGFKPTIPEGLPGS
jgi:hypothetical protein